METDRLVHWLVSSLELQASVFHVGQYCGAWRASTAGRSRASFHLILRGTCFLHLANQAPVALEANDAVFLLRDIPHSLTPERDPGPGCVPRPMLSMQPELPDGTSLACGFFDFRGLPGELLVGAFPDYLLIHRDSATLSTIAPLFEMILAEADRDEAASSPLIERLTELLFFYVLRDMAQRREVQAGLWRVAGEPRFRPLVDHLLREPGRDWSVEDMAQVVNMSRTKFFRHFVEASGQSPGQFLLSLRMGIAAQRLREGESVTRTAEQVGYQSPAAFTRAFQKVIGEQPGAYQRARRH